MGRRLRHFNPVHAGAAFALDARFITSVANGASVFIWNSRPGATFSFANSSNFPTFSASVSAAGNQPGVSFDSASSQTLVTLDVGIPSGSNTFTYIEFSTGGNGFITFAQSGDRTRIGSYFNSPVYNVIFHRGYSSWLNSSDVAQTLDEGTYTNGVIAWARQNGTAQEAGIGTLAQNSRTSSGTLRGTYTSNYSLSDPRTGVHHAAALFPVALSNALQNRIVQSYAASFKVAI